MIVTVTSTMMFKPLNEAPQYLSDLFVRLSDFHTRKLRKTKNELTVLLMRSKVSGQKAFSHRSTNVWNKLNNNTKEASSVYSIKSRLRWLGYENL